MLIPTLTLIAAITYLAIAAYIGYRVQNSSTERHVVIPPKLLGITTLALGIHCLTLYQTISVGAGINLSIENVTALVSAIVVLLYVLESFSQPVGTLGVVVLPISALSLLATLFAPNQQIISIESDTGVGTHILLSLIAYSLLAIAALQAMALAYQVNQLEHKTNSLLFRTLPPLQTMEKLLFGMISVGFAVLSLALLTAIPLINSVIEQHLLHKTILSIIAWIVFAIVLVGHYIAGWRGKTAVRWTLSGFAVLILAYFGSKFVLEILIGKSWS